VSLLREIAGCFDHDDPDVIGDHLWLAGQLLERWNCMERGTGPVAGWPDEVTDEELDLARVNQLRQILISFIREHGDHVAIGTAVWALGKLPRAEDEPLFAEVLRAELDGRGDVLHQALIALDNLDRLPPSDQPRSFAASNVDANRELARQYLAGC
jgi:hypothetical protein